MLLKRDNGTRYNIYRYSLGSCGTLVRIRFKHSYRIVIRKYNREYFSCIDHMEFDVKVTSE